MSVRRPRPRCRRRGIRQGQDGNFITITAISLVVLLGIATLVIDIGFDLGQRRFMQNGADAAALAAARMLADSVSPYPQGTRPQGIPHFFGVTDAIVFNLAYDIAERNQSSGITGRTTDFSVTVEYCVAANDNSYSAAPGCPSPNSWVTSTGSGARVPDGAYKVRVTVSSTFTTFLGSAVGHETLSTRAQAIAGIRGVCPPEATGNIWPFTLWDQQDFGTDPNTLFDLWSSNAPGPWPGGSPWKNVLDLSAAAAWCDGINPDYGWRVDGDLSPKAFPSTDGDQGNVRCFHVSPPEDGEDTTWNRAGYSADPRHPGTGIATTDLPEWAACTFEGTLQVGNKVPTYVDAGYTGDGGQNVATGIYGPGTASCADGTSYFFQGATQIDPAHPSWGPYRNVWVFTYDNPEYWSNNEWVGPNAVSGGQRKQPGRIELIRILPMRIYQDYSTANSRIYGRVVSPVFPPDDHPPLCGVGPGIFGNVVRLGS